MTEAAKEEVRELARWWRRNCPAARIGVSKAFKAKLKVLQNDPEIGVPCARADLSNIRRIEVHATMPYMIYYAFDPDKNELFIHLVWSSMRTDPDI